MGLVNSCSGCGCGCGNSNCGVCKRCNTCGVKLSQFRPKKNIGLNNELILADNTKITIQELADFLAFEVEIPDILGIPDGNFPIVDEGQFKPSNITQDDDGNIVFNGDLILPNNSWQYENSLRFRNSGWGQYVKVHDHEYMEVLFTSDDVSSSRPIWFDLLPEGTGIIQPIATDNLAATSFQFGTPSGGDPTGMGLIKSLILKAVSPVSGVKLTLSADGAPLADNSNVLWQNVTDADWANGAGAILTAGDNEIDIPSIIVACCDNYWFTLELHPTNIDLINLEGEQTGCWCC